MSRRVDRILPFQFKIEHLIDNIIAEQITTAKETIKKIDVFNIEHEPLVCSTQNPNSLAEHTTNHKLAIFISLHPDIEHAARVPLYQYILKTIQKKPSTIYKNLY